MRRRRRPMVRHICPGVHGRFLGRTALARTAPAAVRRESATATVATSGAVGGGHDRVVVGLQTTARDVGWDQPGHALADRDADRANARRGLRRDVVPEW